MVKSSKTYFEVLRWASSFLDQQGKEVAIAEYLLLKRLGWTKTQWLIHMKELAPESLITQLEQDLARIAEDYPPQYLIGHEEFFGEEFLVTEATLIPRPETEELVALCLAQEASVRQKVLDIGTGTGAIAISLKKQRPNWQVTATDLSPAALAVAAENAQRLAADVTFYCGDLTAPVKDQRFDVILSNPPYISADEWDEMDASVRTYEPKTALFAEKAGYAIYERLAKEVPLLLNPNGTLYLEIGYRQGEKVKKMLETAFPNGTVTLHQDLNGLPRMLVMKNQAVDKI